MHWLRNCKGGLPEQSRPAKCAGMAAYYYYHSVLPGGSVALQAQPET